MSHRTIFYSGIVWLALLIAVSVFAFRHKFSKYYNAERAKVYNQKVVIFDIPSDPEFGKGYVQVLKYYMKDNDIKKTDFCIIGYLFTDDSYK